ncbi:uncharacterized protein LOC121977233 [Zingiber officinale]|uniref:uncharacterized protein LOC121977233 n=1 Tax=Zingiber officinale TaxID=94328 RepID=UPI001C4CA209|nr:uncharacterized protein LOC121977233 [Zingiber officinale]
MRRELFLRIVEALQNHSEYFQLRVDATGKKGLSPLQKCTAAIRQLAYGALADHYDEYLRVAEKTFIEYLFNFCRCVIDVFGARYLRRLNATDIQRLLQMHEQRHGFPGSRNDINVLNESPLFNNILQGNATEVNFTINDIQYTKGYYLTDEIYPQLATFVKSFPCPQDPKREKFKERQEATRNDVEQAFRVLQSRWAIVRGPCRFWYKSNLKDIMLTCIILDNMIVEDEGDAVRNWSDEDSNDPLTQINQGSTEEFREYIRKNCELRDNQVHHQLRVDLVEHIWTHYDCDE